MKRIAVKTFPYRHEAELARTMLEARGIKAWVGADDCGSLDPALGFARGVELLVAAGDLPRAAELLEETATP